MELVKKLGLTHFEVRGEIFMEVKDFEKLNAKREESGEKTFANPRNFSAGTIKLQDPQIVSQRPLKIFCYFQEVFVIGLQGCQHVVCAQRSF